MKKNYLLLFLSLSILYSPAVHAHSNWVVDFIKNAEIQNIRDSKSAKKIKSKKRVQQRTKLRNPKQGLKRHPLAIFGLLSSLYFIGWAVKVFAFPFIGYVSSRSILFVIGGFLSALSGLIGMAAGLIAISRIKKFPEKFKGKKMAKWAWMIGAIATFLTLLLLFL